jgi:hypothetical protein
MRPPERVQHVLSPLSYRRTWPVQSAFDRWNSRSIPSYGPARLMPSLVEIRASVVVVGDSFEVVTGRVRTLGLCHLVGCEVDIE